MLARYFILIRLQFLKRSPVGQGRDHAAQSSFKILKVDNVTADTSQEFVASGLRVDAGFRDISFVYLVANKINRITFGRSNTQDAGCDEQQLKRKSRLPKLYRPTNTGSASLRICVVLVRAMGHQVQDVAEAY